MKTTPLRLAPEFAYYSLENAAVALVSERTGVRVLAGTEWLLVLEPLRRACTLAALAAQLAERLAPVKTQRMVAYLQREGFVVEAEERMSELRVYGSPGATSEQPAVLPVRVSLRACGTSDLTSLRQLLDLSGMVCDASAPLAVVVTDDYLRPDLATWNTERLRQQQPWVLVKPAGQHVWVGPLFVPGHGPCWQCFAARHRERHQAQRYLGSMLQNDPWPVPPLLATVASRVAALAWLPALLERFIVTGQHEPMSHTIWTSNVSEGTWQPHTLIRRPQCPQCGDPTAAMPQPSLTLEPRHKQWTADGGHRVVEAAQTLEQFRHHISPVTGVADALIPAHVDEQILCYRVVKSDTSRIDTLRQLLKPLEPLSVHDWGVSWGKGLSHTQAQVSALAEALERYCLMQERPPDSSRARFVDLGPEAVDPRTLVHFSDRQYTDTSARQAPYMARVPAQRFDPQQLIGWTAGWSLTEQRPRLLPSDFCWLTSPKTRDADFCHADSNGCAAGNTLEEAILQGLFELIERDSVALWWYNRLLRPALDLASVAGAPLVQIQQHYRQALARDLWVLDVTADCGIPACVAVAALPDSPYPECVLGLGCHLDPALAVQRAVTELGLIMASWQPFLSPRGQAAAWDSASQECPTSVEQWLRHSHRDTQRYLWPADHLPLRRRSDFHTVSHTDLLEDIHWCVARLAHLGIEVIVVNMTRPDIGLPVVRVVAPGLRHFRPQLGPGRLYDVPVRLGWLTQPQAEADLNPLAMPL